MYIPIIPSTRTTIINKNIVYSDTVLPLKELGSNIKVTKISNINDSNIEKCLQIIFDSNKNITFNTIQYSRNNKELYFYTNEPISTKKWEEAKIKTYTPLTNTSEILEEIKNIFLQEKNKEEDHISLFEVSKLLKKKNNELDRIQKSYEEKMEYLIKEKYGKSSDIIIYDFDYENNEIKIGFKYINDYQKITFSKKENDLYITKSESCWDKEIIVLLGTLLSELYDKQIQFKEIKNQHSYFINPINSNFLINIDIYGLSIYTQNSNNKYMHDFELSSKSYTDEYKYNCNSNAIISTIKGKEDDLLKRIYIKIKDCPKWTQHTLIETRKKQLLIENQKEEELKQKERKKQKRLELKRKLFPFLK